MEAKADKSFLYVAIILYSLAVILSFLKIYIYAAYPTYYSEEEFPTATEQISNAINLKFK